MSQSDPDGPSIAVDLEGFKKLVAQFCKAAPDTYDMDQLEAGIKCVNLGYLGMTANKPWEIAIAVTFYEYANKKYLERYTQLWTDLFNEPVINNDPISLVGKDVQL